MYSPDRAAAPPTPSVHMLHLAHRCVCHSICTTILLDEWICIASRRNLCHHHNCSVSNNLSDGALSTPYHHRLNVAVARVTTASICTYREIENEKKKTERESYCRNVYAMCVDNVAKMYNWKLNNFIIVSVHLFQQQWYITYIHTMIETILERVCARVHRTSFYLWSVPLTLCLLLMLYVIIALHKPRAMCTHFIHLQDSSGARWHRKTLTSIDYSNADIPIKWFYIY